MSDRANRVNYSTQGQKRALHGAPIRWFVWVVFLLVAPALLAQTRIVSTSPSITETLFALGLGDRVVGVSQFCNYPPEVRKLPRIGSYLQPDPEAIARLTPDLVVLQQEASLLEERLQAVHLRVVMVPHATLEDIYKEIQIVGDAGGVPDHSRALIAQIRSQLAAIQVRAKSMPSPRVLLIIDREQGTLHNLIAVGPDNYVNQILEMAGATNVLSKPGLPPYPTIALETVLREDPDVIIDLSGTQQTEEARRVSRAATLALWGQNRALRAVRDGRVYAGTSDVLVVPGPRTPLATQRLFDFVHGLGGTD